MRFLKAPNCAICGKPTKLCQGLYSVFHMVFKCNHCKTVYDHKTGGEIFNADYAIDNGQDRSLHITKRSQVSRTHGNTII